ncbi:MAG TPA: S8 family serine peptidase [Candidatus Nitrosotalea sp.]|nr:S8 family serine peptidase [Candidatus Nitrosotalea sp.]
MVSRLLVFSLVCVFSVVLFVSGSSEQEFSGSLQKSIALVGAKAARLQGLDGQGTKVAVIDTGVDYNHPNLSGYGPGGKVVGGYDYVSPGGLPLDTNGHGTEVAGIIAAEGNFSGVAPKAKLLAYKVSSTGESVSSDLIVKAIEQAAQDGANVINISLGINRTNDQIDNAIDEVVRKGIVVVVAAGNNGPQNNTIGSPGMDAGAITVGATYNNLTSSLTSTFEVGKRQYQVLPLLGTREMAGPVTGKLVYGGYGRAEDLKNLDVKGSILLEARGSDVKGQKVYFTEKEENAARFGARALVIFNNQSGIFVGELVNPEKNSTFVPKIPVISISREDGLALKSSIGPDTTASLDAFFHPDYVAPFSSEGPVSPFYIKPDLVAPGVFVNSTTLGGKYNVTSGTSFAAPHVAGAAALVLQKHPLLSPDDVASLLVTTTDPVTDAYGKLLPISAVGSGRLNITRALGADIIPSPHELVFTLSYGEMSEERTVHLKPLGGSAVPSVSASFFSSEPGLDFAYSQSGDALTVKVSAAQKKPGDYDGFIVIRDPGTAYRIPVLVHVTPGTIIADQVNGTIHFSLSYPGPWSYAKISLIDAETGDKSSTSITPQDVRALPAYSSGQYWVLAQIQNSTGTDEAYTTLVIDQPAQRSILDVSSIGVPAKQMAVVAGVISVIAAVGLVARARKN